eukprot:3677871-Rhodomonas_salina.2
MCWGSFPPLAGQSWTSRARSDCEEKKEGFRFCPRITATSPTATCPPSAPKNSACIQVTVDPVRVFEHRGKSQR